MKRVIFLFGLLLVLILLYFFFKKHYITYSAYYKIPNVHSGFYPDAYDIFHSQDDLKRFFDIDSETRTYRDNLKRVHFDFTKYSYIIVYGAKIDKMYYSSKTTMFDDPSPSYAKARRYGKLYVVINYASQVDSCIYFYRIDKNIRLRGSAGD